MELKGLRYSVIEFPPPIQMAAMKALFGSRTVPAIQIDSEKLSGSRAILARLDQLVAQPPLFPADPEQRAAVEAAEAWGDEVLQPLVRRLLWPSFKAHPELMAAYSEGSKLPPVPAVVLKAIAPLITGIEIRANRASEATYAADLQIAASLRLLMTFADLGPIFAGRPCSELALRCFPKAPGHAPVGTIPAALLPSAA